MLDIIPSFKKADILKLLQMAKDVLKGNELHYVVHYIDFENESIKSSTLRVREINVEATTENYDDILELFECGNTQITSVCIQVQRNAPAKYTMYKIDCVGSTLEVMNPVPQNAWNPEALMREGFTLGWGGIRELLIKF